MGVLDTPAPILTSQHSQPLLSRLHKAQENAVLAVLGDSTGNETTEWVYRLGQYLAAAYPAYTVNHRLWNDSGQNYDSATVIQTGSGAVTLDIYNASTPGQVAGYSFTRLASQVPATPHLVMVSYAHNSPQDGPAYKPLHYQLCRDIAMRFPQAPIINVLQNPEAVGGAGALTQLKKVHAVMELSAQEGYGSINVMQRFLDYGNYTADLLNVDGIHPNSAGMDIWVTETNRHFQRRSTELPLAAHHRPEHLWVPASAFIVSEGTPALANHNETPMWELDPASQEGIITSVSLPAWWSTFDMYCIWSTAAGSTANVRWEGAARTLATYQAFAGTTPGGVGVNTTITQAGRAGAFQQEAAQLYTAGTFQGRTMMFRIRRIAADAADTLTADALVTGMLLRRAS